MSKYQNYDAIEAAGLVGSKRKLAIGRNGAKVEVRNYTLDDAEEVPALKEAHTNGDKLPNPFNAGFQHYLLETMKKLGLNKNHSMDVVLAKFKEITSDAETKNKDGKTFWQTWSKKEPRNKNGRDMIGRFEQNIQVYQRLGGCNPCGRKLLQLGTKVLGTKGVVYDVVIGSLKKPMIRLNTDSDKPVNETKRSYKTSETVETAPEAPEVTAPATEPITESTVTVEPTVTATEPAITPVAEAPATEVKAEPVATETPAETVAA